MAKVVSLLYTLLLTGAALYAVYILVLILLYLRHQNAQGLRTPVIPENRLPEVTVQIPVRNERYVVRQVLGAVAQLDWPRERLHIQVLDDSDDETTDLVMAEADRLRVHGFDVVVIHRSRPEGYKAGALAEGTARTRASFIAIFDADFCPPPDFLRRTVPFLLADSTIGMVQARWTYLNADTSLVTRMQALALDAHFSVEQIARSCSGMLMNANGSATVWRKAAIQDAGGWQDDTVTEDLDLSFRLQLAGWKALYVPDVAVPSELPLSIVAFREQQARWAKGASQCLRKLLGPILRSPYLSLPQKVAAIFHLAGYGTQFLVLAMVLLTVPMILTPPTFSTAIVWAGAVAAVPPLMYLLGQMRFYQDWPRRILVYPVLMFLWIGLSWRLTLALLDGLWRWGGTFVRTPKFGECDREDARRDHRYHPHLDASWLGELFLGGYTVVAVWLAVRFNQTHLILLVVSYALGHLMLWASALSHAATARRPA